MEGWICRLFPKKSSSEQWDCFLGEDLPLAGDPAQCRRVVCAGGHISKPFLRHEFIAIPQLMILSPFPTHKHIHMGTGVFISGTSPRCQAPCLIPKGVTPAGGPQNLGHTCKHPPWSGSNSRKGFSRKGRGNFSAWMFFSGAWGYFRLSSSKSPLKMGFFVLRCS